MRVPAPFRPDSVPRRSLHSTAHAPRVETLARLERSGAEPRATDSRRRRGRRRRRTPLPARYWGRRDGAAMEPNGRNPWHPLADGTAQGRSSQERADQSSGRVRRRERRGSGGQQSDRSGSRRYRDGCWCRSPRRPCFRLPGRRRSAARRASRGPRYPCGRER